VSAELEARKTAAAALCADFRREADDYLDRGADRPEYDSWAWRLYTALGLLLDGIDTAAGGGDSR
jgi:hypothetical protein